MKDSKDSYRDSEQNKAENLFSNPNDLAESLKHLEKLEDFVSTDAVFQSDKADNPIIEKREPFEDGEKIKINKKAAENIIEKKVSVLDDPKEIDALLDAADSYEKYLHLEK